MVTGTVPLAGFAAGGSAVASPSLAGFGQAEPPESVVTSLAGLGSRPQRPDRRTVTPADPKYPAAVSRRSPVSFSMRRNVQPSWPSAITCFCFSFFKTLLTLTEPNAPPEIMS